MRHILLCDDTPVQMERLKQLVRQLVGDGALVEARSSLERLEQALREAPIPDTVLMDIELGPDECGIDAAKRLFPARTGV